MLWVCCQYLRKSCKTEITSHAERSSNTTCFPLMIEIILKSMFGWKLQLRPVWSWTSQNVIHATVREDLGDAFEASSIEKEIRILRFCSFIHAWASLSLISPKQQTSTHWEHWYCRIELKHSWKCFCNNTNRTPSNSTSIWYLQLFREMPKQMKDSKCHKVCQNCQLRTKFYKSHNTLRDFGFSNNSHFYIEIWYIQSCDG